MRLSAARPMDAKRPFSRALVLASTMVARNVVIVTIVAVVPTMARAAEPTGCDAFKWPLAKEAALLRAADKPAIGSGGDSAPPGQAFTLKLTGLAEAHLPTPPGRKPKMEPSTAGFVRFDAPTVAGVFEVTISQAAWIDVVQDGHTLKPSGFSGARDCPGVRKSIRFSLVPKPFAIQISGTSSRTVDVLVEPLRPEGSR